LENKLGGVCNYGLAIIPKLGDNHELYR